VRPPALAALAAALAALVTTAAAEPIQLTSSRVTLFPAKSGQRTAGSLIFRGGLVLSSPSPDFGGWSGLGVSADGREMLAISDEAHWLGARLSYDSNGDLSAASDGDMAPMLDESGRPMRGKEGDAEGLALIAPNEVHGTVVVSFERNVRVWRYDLFKGFGARPTDVPIGNWVKKLHDNRQIEAVALLRPDTLIAFGETKVNPGDDILAAFEAYPGVAGHPQTRLLSVAPHDPFAITAAAPDGHGGLFLLERRFSLLGGLGMEVRQVGAAELHPAARIEGRVLVNLAAQDATIDNMEGLAVREDAARKTLLYLISDDNFSPLQRTLLLMFEVGK
jgi:hypothetical protein